MKKRKKQKRIWLGALSAAAVAGALTYAIRREQSQLEVREYTIGNPSGNGTPLRLLQLSDLHLRHQLDGKHHALAEIVRRLQPDLILLTGDALDKRGEVSVLANFLSLLPAEVPKAAIMGNHDYRTGVRIKTLQEVYRQHQGDLLINQSQTYTVQNIPVTVTGIDDCIRGNPDVARAFRDVRRVAHHFVLIHSPVQQTEVLRHVQAINAKRPETDELTISYFLAGHTHGGQVQLFGYAPYMPKKTGPYLNGWYTDQQPFLYVSKGFGTSFLPIRWGARSEVTLFHYFA